MSQKSQRIPNMQRRPSHKRQAQVQAEAQSSETTDANGLVYLRNRYYNPNIGTFISQDPYEGSANIPMSLNRYAYVQGNPVNKTDPSGLIPVQAMNSLMQSNPLAFAKMMNSGVCYQAPAAGCNFIQAFFGLCPTPVGTSTPTPSPTATPTPTFTPTPIFTPTPTATPTDSPDVNPCSTRTLFPVFGSCEGCTPHVAGQGYNPPSHRALDLVPAGVYVQDFVPPNWATDSGTAQYSTVYAVADGTVYSYGTQDALVLRLSDTWEFVYVHITPLVTSGTFVTAGMPIGVVIPHTNASVSAAEGHSSDEDHLHLGLRHPSQITQSLNPASCLPGLVGG